MGCPHCIVKRKVRLEQLVHRKAGTTDAFIQVNSEVKDVLAMLVEAIGTNHNDRYNKIHCHWGGNILGFKSVAHIANWKRLRPKN